MKKLLMSIALLSVAGCTQLSAGLKAGVAQVETSVKAPPTFVMDGAQAILKFLESILGAALNTVLHQFLPF